MSRTRNWVRDGSHRGHPDRGDETKNDDYWIKREK